MNTIKRILLAILDPISTFTTKSFPEKVYKLFNKSFLVQIVIAVVITTLLILMR